MEHLKNEIINAVKKSACGEKVGLFFSGGLDSSVIGKILSDLGIDVLAVTVGEKGSSDVEFSKSIAGKIFQKHTIIYADRETVEKIIPEVIKLTKLNDIVSVSVGCVVYLAAKYASMMGIKTVITGAGSDEIFAGYSSHEKALEKGYSAVQKECKKRLKNITKDIERDRKICRYFGLEVKTPFLDKNVVKIAMKLNPKQKISKTEKKIVLRQIAKELSLPELVFSRRKKAAQYGSGIQNIIKKISRKNGFKTINAYINNIYKKQRIL